ncbi:MAG: mechanosensitive ion channel [Hymenobacter sp.]|nr:mechanosensitive ion channel [Hymenobacter sp.]
MDKLETYGQQLQALTLLYLPRLLMAVLLFALGWWIIGRVSRLIAGAVARFDVSLRGFLTSMVSIVLKVLLLISVAGMVGIETTSFVAILGAAGLAIGLALQGTLANFAGGVLILIFKPYVVGDVIESQGRVGLVKEIQIFNTILATPQGDTIILPNGATSNNVIVNKTTENQTLVELLIDVDGSDASLEQLRALGLPLLLRDEQLLREPAPSVSIVALVPGGMRVAFRGYARPTDADAAQGRLVEQLQQVLATHDIGPPVRRRVKYKREKSEKQ